MTARLIRSFAALTAGAAALGVSILDVPAADMPVPKVLPPEASTPSVPADFVFGARFQSDYIFRGISQSNRDPSGQSYFELQLFDNFLYGGFATYKVDLPTRPTMELDITGGIRPKWGPFSFDLGFIYYNYPNERRLADFTTGTFFSPANTDFLEFAGKASYSAFDDALTIGANVFYAYNYLGTRADGTYVSGTAKYAFPAGTFGFMPEGFAVSGEFGHYFLGRTSVALGSINLPDYNTWNIGASYTWKNLTLDLRYYDTDLNRRQCGTLTGDPRGIFNGSGTSSWCHEAFVATLSLDFVGSKLNGIFADEPAAAAPTPMERGAPPRARDATGQAIR